MTRPRRALTKWKARAIASEDRAHRANMIHHAVELVIALHEEEGDATVTITRHRPGGDDVRIVEVGPGRARPLRLTSHPSEDPIVVEVGL